MQFYFKETAVRGNSNIFWKTQGNYTLRMVLVFYEPADTDPLSCDQSAVQPAAIQLIFHLSVVYLTGDIKQLRG